MELRQLVQLKRKGLSNRKVAEALGVSRNTVNTYVKTFSGQELGYEQLEELTEAELAGQFIENLTANSIVFTPLNYKCES